MKITFYTIRIGGKLYLESTQFFTSQRTTSNVFAARRFDTYQDAEKVAKKTFGGEIVELTLSDESEADSELDMMRASIKQLQKERDAALNELNLYKMKE